MHVVTGASEGIGRAVATELAARGETVVAVARNRSRLAELQAGHPGLEVVTADLATESGRQTLVSALEGRGRLDSVVHCAGSRVEPGALMDIDAVRLVDDFAIHVAGVIGVTRDLLKANGLGTFVIFDSYLATTPRVGWGGYSVVKAAAQMVARLLESELGEVEVLRLYPGAVRTDLLRTVLDSPPSPAREAYRSMESAGDVADPADVARWSADIILEGAGSVSIQHFEDTRPRPPRFMSGGCLCAGVRYRIDGVVRDVIDCHCERCRRTSGSHVTAARVALDDLEVVSSESLRWFAVPDDPNVEYGFCDRCGSSLFWRAGGDDAWSVFAGALDPPTRLRTVAAWHTTEAADHTRIDPTVPAYRTEPHHIRDGDR